MLVPLAYNHIITERGYSLKAIGHNAAALAREDAVTALEALNGSSIAVVGGDVYKMEATTIRPTRDGWYVERKASESVGDYIKRSQDAARVFVEKYPHPKITSLLAHLGARAVCLEKYADIGPHGGSILFTLSLSELGVTPVVP